MEKPLADIYRDYIACLNGQDWENLGHFVHQAVSHNGRAFGLAGYRAMLEQDFVFYTFENGLIKEVWSIIDKASIEAQL